MINSLTKIIGISIAAFVAVVLIASFMAKPILGQIDNLHNQEARQRSQLDQLSAQLDAYNQAKTQLKQVNYTDVIDGAIVKREDLAEAITELEDYAAKTNVTESITITDTINGPSNSKLASIVPGEKNIGEVPYDLHFSATFPDTLNFLQYLEHLPHFTEISNLSFSAQNPGGGGSSAPNQLAVHTNYITGTISGVFFVKK